MNIVYKQKEICDKFNSPFLEVKENMIIGVSLSVLNGEFPVNGVRINPEGVNSGWYLWAGDFSDKFDFFKPIHIKHLDKYNGMIKKYLGLNKGWRFLITPTYEDAWQDNGLL